MLEDKIKLLLGYTKEEWDEILDDIIRIHSLEKSERSCYPDTCQGQCQGMGWCYTCEEFMDGNMLEDHFEELMG